MVGRRYTLPQLFEPRAPKDRAELRLPEQKALQRHCLVDDDVGQHAKLFKSFEGQVLRLIHNQQHTPAVALLRQHEVGYTLKQGALGQPFFTNTEPACHEVQKVISSQLGGYYLRSDKITLVDCRQQVVYKNGFTRTDFAGNDEEALGVMQPVYQIGHRLPMHRAFEEKPGIRGKLEGRGSEPVKFSVHDRQNVLLSKNCN